MLSMLTLLAVKPISCSFFKSLFYSCTVPNLYSKIPN